MSFRLINGASRRAMRKTGQRQYRSGQASGNLLALPSGMLPSMPPVHPTFDTTPTYYLPSMTLIRRPDDMLSSPIGQPILDYEPPHGFVIPAFTMFNGSVDPYDHMLHYNQAMTLISCNDRLLCKVFSANLRGTMLA